MTIKTNAWINPRNGETRHYINFKEWAPAAGITEDISGNLHFPAARFIRSKRISRANLRKLKEFKVWADGNGKITVQNFINFYNWGVDSAEEFAQKLEDAFAELGGLDFIAAPAKEAEQAQAEPEAEEVEEAVKFSGSLTDEEVAIIEAAAAGPLHKYYTPKEAATEAADEIAKKYGVNLLEIYNAYLKAKGQRTWPVFTPASRHFGLLFEA